MFLEILTLCGSEIRPKLLKSFCLDRLSDRRIIGETIWVSKVGFRYHLGLSTELVRYNQFYETSRKAEGKKLNRTPAG